MLRRACFALLLTCLPLTLAMAQPKPGVIPAIDGVLDAFRTHPLVGLSDFHNLAQELDFYAALVRDPRLPGVAQDVVVEFGSAQSQPLLDRYLAGEELPPEQLRAIWSDRAGWVPGGVRLGYVNFFAQVRAVNLTLPPERRIRVWLGDPPIDWAKVRSKEDWLPILRQRGDHPADLIEREILAKGRKALVIYGGTHFFEAEDGPLLSLGPLLRRKHPDTFFIVTPYAGFNEKPCSIAFEKKASGWPVPALVTPLQGTTLAPELVKAGCHAAPPGGSARADAIWSGLAGDALLYLGPSDRLVMSPLLPDIYLDTAYRAELSRRNAIILGKPLTNGTVDRNPATPLPWRP